MNDTVAMASAEQLDSEEFKSATIRTATVEPLELDVDGIRSEVEDKGRYEVSVTCQLPFSGNSTLLDNIPSTFPSSRPQGKYPVGSGWDGRPIEKTITFSTTSRSDQPEAIRAWRDDFVALLGQWVMYANSDARTHNEGLESQYTQAVSARRAVLEQLKKFKDEI